MGNINFVNKVATKSTVEFFFEQNYVGCILVLPRGIYRGDMITAVGSLKVSDFTKVVFYEYSDGTGRRLIIEESCNKLVLPFVPQVIAIETYVRALGQGQAIDLPEGKYVVDELKIYDKLIIPRGFYVVFCGSKQDEHKICFFENEVCQVDEKFDEYEDVVLFTLGNDDVRINFSGKEELEDDELLAVAGGKQCKTVAISCGCFCGVRTEALN